MIYFCAINRQRSLTDAIIIFFPILQMRAAEHVFGSGMPNDKEGERGIVAATGVCFCSSLGKCTCSNEKSSADSYISPNPAGVMPNRLADAATDDRNCEYYYCWSCAASLAIYILYISVGAEKFCAPAPRGGIFTGWRKTLCRANRDINYIRILRKTTTNDRKWTQNLSRPLFAK